MVGPEFSGVEEPVHPIKEDILEDKDDSDLHPDGKRGGRAEAVFDFILQRIECLPLKDDIDAKGKQKNMHEAIGKGHDQEVAHVIDERAKAEEGIILIAGHHPRQDAKGDQEAQAKGEEAVVDDEFIQCFKHDKNYSAKVWINGENMYRFDRWGGNGMVRP